MSRKRDYSEPWSPMAIAVDALLDPDNVDVNRFTKREVKALAEAETMTDIIGDYVVDVTWLKKLLFRYKRNKKSEDGWSVKVVEKIVRASSTRLSLALGRLRTIVRGGEDIVEE